MEKFAETKLSTFLEFEVPKEMIDNLMALKNIKDIRDYLEQLLDTSDSKHRQFINDFITKKKSAGGGPSTTTRQKQKKSKPKANESEVMVDKKSDFDALEKQYQLPDKKGSNGKDKWSIGQKNAAIKMQSSDTGGNISRNQSENSLQKYKKPIYTPIDYDKRVPLLPGRRFCGCFAKQHTLVNNCMGCGRLACEQEGSGPCMFCGTLVVTKAERVILDSDTDKSSKLLNKLMSQTKPYGWEKAVERQAQMRDADRARKERQKVIDDQTDYFSLVSTWEKPKTTSENNGNNVKKSSNEKVITTKVAQAKKTQKGIRFDDKWRLTMAGMLRDDVCDFGQIDKSVEEFLETLPEMTMIELREKLFYQDPRTVHMFDVNPDAPEYDWENEFWELNDYFDRFGLCLSVRQPWASLIVAGIKKYEGRTSNIEYRGTIWIASGGKEPTADEIATAEKFYKRINEGKEMNFPKSYPTGRLLGRINIKRCLEHDEYLEKYPRGEVDDDFVIVFEQAIPLPILFPMRGCPGLFFLPKKLHTAAGLLIRRVIRDNPDIVNVNE